MLTRWRSKAGLKASYGLRAFFLYIVILGFLSWFILDHAVERLNDGMRQAAESVMVDGVNILASLIETQIEKSSDLNVSLIEKVLATAKERRFLATIYQVDKVRMESDLYITDSVGKVVYDSTGKDIGNNFSNWRDVYLTLNGQYGARTSFTTTDTKTGAPKAMVVAAPLFFQDTLVGSVSLVQPIQSLESHLDTETAELRKTMYLATGIALLVGFVLSILFSRSINKIVNYADSMANGIEVQQPQLLDQRLSDLAESVRNLRLQLDGKEYVEQYVHSLTHELKTPITSVRGSVELLFEDLPEQDKRNFLANIQTSNDRMARLVDRMLSLAKLESQKNPIEVSSFDIVSTTNRIIQERETLLMDKQLTTSVTGPETYNIKGDRVLLAQAIANVLDNAIHFCHSGSTIHLNLRSKGDMVVCDVKNTGPTIPDWALSKVFDRFFSLPANSSQSHSHKSTGLGLSFVREIMARHQGTVTITNIDTGVKTSLSWQQIN